MALLSRWFPWIDRAVDATCRAEIDQSVKRLRNGYRAGRIVTITHYFNFIPYTDSQSIGLSEKCQELKHVFQFATGFLLSLGLLPS